MKIEYWIGLADILLRIPDIHVGPLNTMSDIVMSAMLGPNTQRCWARTQDGDQRHQKTVLGFNMLYMLYL